MPLGSTFHLPNIKGSSDISFSGIIKQENFSIMVDCFCWINPRGDTCPPSLRKAFQNRMINLGIHTNFNPT